MTRHSCSSKDRQNKVFQNPVLPLPSVPGSLDEDGNTLLTLALIAADLTVEVIWWSTMLSGFQIILLWDGVRKGSPVPITQSDVDDPTTIFQLTLPVAEMVNHGTYQLSYVVELPSGLNPTESRPITVLVDREAPGGGRMPDLQFVPGTGDPITEDDLDPVTGFETLVADYADMKVNDVVTPWIGEQNGVTGEYLPGAEEVVDDGEVANGSVSLFFPRAALEKYGDGVVAFSYKLRDWVGNETADHAPVVTRYVRLKEVKPEITQVTGDNGDVPNGGSTEDTLLTVQGIATADSTVQLLDGLTPLGTAPVASDGSWTSLPITFGVGSHSVTARTDGGWLESEPWEFNVVRVIDGLPAPTFPHATIFGYLDCCSVPRIWEGITVRIEGDANFSEGDRIELTWQGCENLNGTKPIPGATATFEKILSPADAINGFELVVLPYDTLIEPMVNNGSATAQYLLYKNGVLSGRSEMDFVKINRTLPSGEICSPLNDICDK
jgi:hypothetical protein